MKLDASKVWAQYMAQTNKPAHPQVSKAQEPKDPYEGLAQCFRNVTNCNVAYKLKYCL